VHIPDEELSRNHCFFEEHNGEVRLTDLASANGTILNGVSLGADSVLLSSGAVIEVRTTRIKVLSADDIKPVGGDKLAAIDLGVSVSH
jgi:pSer/pThr/pTyr-binding forkhead associated (FHA) protein